MVSCDVIKLRSKVSALRPRSTCVSEVWYDPCELMLPPQKCGCVSLISIEAGN